MTSAIVSSNALIVAALSSESRGTVKLLNANDTGTLIVTEGSLTDGLAEGEELGVMLGEALGLIEGAFEGLVLGDLLGLSEGLALGLTDGEELDDILGEALGLIEGAFEGPVLGDLLGLVDGTLTRSVSQI
jgi:hypothetical protein